MPDMTNDVVIATMMILKYALIICFFMISRLSSDENVAPALYRSYEFGIRRVILDLLAQIVNMDHYGIVISLVIHIPYAA